MVGITQPRRVAAITVATRVAEEMGVEVHSQLKEKYLISKG